MSGLHLNTDYFVGNLQKHTVVHIGTLVTA